ncbi:MAG: ABC transporter ATP-binding protein, partial [Symbiobacteriaceae bacterium]|nr:ABC transporter ATP-binding protein [Symbiobacteriaceae bacterium]
MGIILRVAKEAARYKALLLTSAFSSMVLTFINLTAPRLMSQMTGLVAAGLDEESLQQILRLAGMLFAIYLIRILFRYLSDNLAHRAAWRLVEELRLKVYGKLQALSIDYFRDRQTGDLVSRCVSDTAQFEQLYAHLLPDMMTNLVTVTGVTIILFSINSRLAGLTCLPIPFILISGWFFSTKVRPNFRVMQRAMGNLSAQLVDNFSGIQEIQIFGQQQPAQQKVGNRAREFTTAMLRALHLSAVFHPSVEFCTSLGTVIVVGFGGYLAYLRQLEVQDIVAFLLYLSLFYAPITGLARLLESTQQALAGAERVIEILDAPEVIQSKPGALILPKPKGRITFEEVSFSYREDVPVLEDISFDVEPGQMIALVGAT